MKKIGLLGLAFGSTNKGCEALGYGFLNVLERVAKEEREEFEIHIFEKCDISLIYLNGVAYFNTDSWNRFTIKH